MPFRNQDIFIGHSESFWRALLPKRLHGTARREKSRPCECSRGPALPVWTSSELFIRSLTDVGWWVLARSQCSSSSQRFWMGLKSGLCAGQFYTTSLYFFIWLFLLVGKKGNVTISWLKELLSSVVDLSLENVPLESDTFSVFYTLLVETLLLESWWTNTYLADVSTGIIYNSFRMERWAF